MVKKIYCLIHKNVRKPKKQENLRNDEIKRLEALGVEITEKINLNFEITYWKLMNNSFYGKTLENIRDRNNIFLVNSGKELRKYTPKPNFKDFIHFSDSFGGVLMNKATTLFNKPIYLGMCILDYSKLIMYEYYYEKINKTWPKNQIIAYDTDSFILQIQTEDVYEDIKKI